MTTADSPPKQLTGRWRDHFETRLELIPPLSEDFSVSGDPGTNERARRWALYNHYLLAAGPTACAHTFYLMPMCPAMTSSGCGCGCASFLDHASIWVPYEEPAEPFLLAHLYRDEIPAETLAYAWAHGLRAESSPLLADGWYEHGTLPVRLSLEHTGTIPWPLGTRATVMVAAYPVRWPKDAEHWQELATSP